MAPSGHGLKKGSFFLPDPFQGTEAFEMRRTDVRDESDVGFGNGCKHCDLSRAVGSHLDDGQFVDPVQLQKGQREADPVVQISLRLEDVPRAGDDGCDHFFR